MRAPVGALGGRWGAFFESAEGGAAGSEIGALPWGRWVRWGWTERTRSLPGGGRPRWAAKADGGPDGADVRAGGCSGSLGPRAVRGEEKGQLKWSGIRFWPMI